MPNLKTDEQSKIDEMKELGRREAGFTGEYYEPSAGRPWVVYHPLKVSWMEGVRRWIFKLTYRLRGKL
jgi:hypothetical protein